MQENLRVDRFTLVETFFLDVNVEVSNFYQFTSEFVSQIRGIWNGYIFLFCTYFAAISVASSVHIYIHRHVFRPSQDSSVWLGLTSREQLMSPEFSKDQVLSFGAQLYIYIYIYIYINVYVHIYIYNIYIIYYILYICIFIYVQICIMYILVATFFFPRCV